MRERLQERKLKEVVHRILYYHDVFFNDEGGSFITEEKMPDADMGFICEWFGYNPLEYAGKGYVKKAMREFFQGDAQYGPHVVMGFLAKYGIDRDLLFHCSRPGEAS